MGRWIVGVMNFQKMYGLKHHIVKVSGDVTDVVLDGTTREDRATNTQLLICEK